MQIYQTELYIEQSGQTRLEGTRNQEKWQHTCKNNQIQQLTCKNYPGMLVAGSIDMHSKHMESRKQEVLALKNKPHGIS